MFHPTWPKFWQILHLHAAVSPAERKKKKAGEERGNKNDFYADV